MPLDVSQRGERFREIAKVSAVFRMGCAELSTDLDRLPVIRQPDLDLAQVHILLTQVAEVDAAQDLVLSIVRRQGDGTLLFLRRFLKCGDRLQIVAPHGMKVPEGIEAASQRSVMPCPVRKVQDEFFEDVDGHLQ